MSTLYLLLFGVLICNQVDWARCHFSASDHDHEEEVHKIISTTASPIADHRFFLQEIFTKYGHKGQMTFEGFEHLMESLGLGNIIISDHDVAAHKENPEINIHDTHDHAKKMDHVDVTTPTGRDHNHTLPEASTTPMGVQDKSNLLSINRHRHSHRNSLQSPITPSEVKYQNVGSTPSSNIGQNSGSQNSLYHYQLKEAKIPELLVNISSLVDQHQEFEEHRPEIIIEQCLSPREILDAFGLNQTSSLNPVSFLHLCPAIIYELDQGHCLFRHHSHSVYRTVPVFDQWLFSSLSVIIISLCGLLSVAVIPIMQKWFYHTLLQFLVGLAVGSLSGDALLHLMPHAMLGGEGSHNHNNPVSAGEAEKVAVWRGFTALFGIFFFFVAERLLAAYAIYRKQKSGAASGSKVDGKEHDDLEMYNGNVGEKLSQYRKSSFNIEPSEKEMIKMFDESSRKPSCESLHSLEVNFQGTTNFSLEPTGNVIYNPNAECAVKMMSNGHGHSHGHSHEVPGSISAVAWMVIMGDGLHNFCDGLAIGTAFASGIEGGISTAVAVFCHELPHELGDFAMLLKTGMKVKEALLYNVLSSVLCFIGMAIGISLGNVHSATSWVFAATAGMFLYIALVDMLPELSASGDQNLSSTYLLAIQVLGICSGASIMLLIANYEQDLKNIIS